MWEVFRVIRMQWNYFLRRWQRRRWWLRCSDELLCAETGVVLQPSVHRASHPTHIHTPSKINFPFRPRFPARLSWEKAFLTPRSVLTVQSSASKTRAGKIKTSDLPQQKKAKQLTLWLLLMMQKDTGSLLRDTFFPPHLSAMGWSERVGNAPLVLSLLTGAFAAWCRQPVVITRLCLSYHYTSVPPALVCQLSSVIRHRAATER